MWAASFSRRSSGSTFALSGCGTSASTGTMDTPIRLGRMGSLIESSLTCGLVGREGPAMAPDDAFTVTCAADFRDDGVWVIQATLRIRDADAPDTPAVVAHG